MPSLVRINDVNANMAHWPTFITAQWQDPTQLPSIPTPNAGSSRWLVRKGEERKKAGRPLWRYIVSGFVADRLRDEKRKMKKGSPNKPREQLKI